MHIRFGALMQNVHVFCKDVDILHQPLLGTCDAACQPESSSCPVAGVRLVLEGLAKVCGVFAGIAPLGVAPDMVSMVSVPSA